MKDEIKFHHGDQVRLKFQNEPVMYVVGTEHDEQSRIKGIRCWWFSQGYVYQSAVFNFKDLLLINRAKDVE